MRRVIGFLFLLGTVLSALPAAASSSLQPSSVSLLAQTAYVPADGEFQAVFSWSGTLTPATSLVARVGQPLTSIDDMSGPSGQVLTQTPITPLATLPRTPDGDYELTLSVRSFPANDSKDLYLPDPGVHPVSIEILEDGKRVGSLEIFLIHLPEEATLIEPVPISVVLPITQAEGLTVGDATAILANHPELPLEVELGVGVVSQLATDAELNDQFRKALGSRQVIVSPTLDLDPSALAEIDQGHLFVRTLTESRRQVNDLGLSPDPSVMPWEGNMTSGGVDLIRGLGIDTILVPPDSPLSPGRLSGPASGLRVVQPDQDLSSRLSGGSEGTQNANHLLAELALLTSEDATPVVLGGEELSGLDPDGLEILLRSLEELGPLEPVSLEVAVSSAPIISSRLSERPGQDLSPIADSISEIESMISTYESFFVEDGPTPSRFDSDLLSALSRNRNPDDRVQRVEQIKADLNRAFESISVSQNQVFTLTSDRFAVPLSLASSQPGPRRVLIRFQSDKIRVYHDKTYTSTEDLLIELEPGDTTLTINVEARALGLSPVDVIVLTPDGKRQLATGQFAVRSTAIPGLGLLLSGAAFVFLLVWWFRHHRKEVKAKETGTAGNINRQADTLAP